MAYFCNEHQVEFFKKGKMKGYAHPLGDGWCNMPEDAEPALVTEAKNLGAEPITTTKDASIARAVAFKGAIDLASNGKIEVKDIGAYSKRYAPWLETGE